MHLHRQAPGDVEAAAILVLVVQEDQVQPAYVVADFSVKSCLRPKKARPTEGHKSCAQVCLAMYFTLGGSSFEVYGAEFSGSLEILGPVIPEKGQCHHVARVLLWTVSEVSLELTKFLETLGPDVLMGEGRRVS